jgi:hypothetical protein
MAMVSDLFDLVLFFIIDQVRRGSGIIGAVCVRFPIWGKKGGMKHWVDQP